MCNVQAILQIIFLFYTICNALEDRCRKYEFRCANSKCIPLSSRCDGSNDCGDNSDEICENSDSFTCTDGAIIPKSGLCDGTKDCIDDEEIETCAKHKCSADRFLCRTKPMICIEMSSVCNNIKNCPDNSDESPEACEFLRKSKVVECNNAYFRCANKQLCIAKIFRCDGNDDCVDKSDEKDCLKPEICKSGKEKCNVNQTTNLPNVKVVNTTVCKKNEFFCGADSPSGCISNDWYCDGSFDCQGTDKDEQNCPNFRCPPNKPSKCKTIDVCFEDVQRCDGYVDCADKSDEENCNKPETEVICDAVKEFKCVKSNKCIAFGKVCDGQDDCGDLSDERPGGSTDNCKKTPCKLNNGDCDQICIPMFHQKKCLCRPGYQIDSQNATKCNDIDECSNDSTCSHKCTNTLGSYQCECFEGFYKTDDYKSRCIAVGEKFLLYSAKNSIRELRLLHHYMEELNRPLNVSVNFVPVGIDFDYKSNNIFWSQFEPKPEIVQMKHSNSKTKRPNLKVLVKNRIHSPVGIAYDWIHGLLFWTDIHYNEISVLNITNGMRRVLLKLPGNSKVRSIVADPKFRRLYWTDWGTDPKIESMGMDGNDRKIIIQKGLITPNGLAMDHYFNELYWVDAKARNVKSYNLKTEKQREIISHLNAYGFDIDVFEDWLYLSDWHNENIIKIHKKTGKQEILISSPKPMGVKLFHQLAQPYGIENVCSNNPCQYLCLPISLNLRNTEKFRCSCPDFSHLLADDKSCSPVSNDNINSSDSQGAETKNLINAPKHEVNIYMVVGFVTAIVLIVLILVVFVGVAMYRNYMRRVIKQATTFNNPTYYRKSSYLEIQILNPDPLLPPTNLYDNTSEQLIPHHQSDDGLQMVEKK